MIDKTIKPKAPTMKIVGHKNMVIGDVKRVRFNHKRINIFFKKA